jgi:PadR family transcriptional regulator PadR
MVSATEMLVLVALARAGESYGRPLIDAIASMPGGRKMTLGTLYPTLHRMESKGLIEGRWGDESDRSEGPRRRYYTPTPDGVRALNEARSLFGLLSPIPAQ